MRIIVDADSCPVKQEIIEIAQKQGREVLLVSALSHYSEQEVPEFVQRIFVDDHDQEVDLRIMNIILSWDVLVTGDYGLAYLALGKKCRVLSPRGTEYTAENIEGLMESRHFSAKIRKAGGRSKGPAPLLDKDRQQFRAELTRLIKNNDFV